MSFEAVTWARRQRCGNPSRKFVLVTLANWADAVGFVKVIRIDSLEETTELSRSVIRQRIKELEVGGALTRERGHHSDGRMVSARLHMEGKFRIEEGPPNTEIQKTSYDGSEQNEL